VADEADEAGGGKRDYRGGPVIDLSGSPKAKVENQHPNFGEVDVPGGSLSGSPEARVENQHPNFEQESRNSSSRGSNSEADMDNDRTVPLNKVVEHGND
jgi:hypothetical protein